MTTTDCTAAIPDLPCSLAPDVLLIPEVDGTARLLDLGGNFYTVSAVGAEMLRETLAYGEAAAVHHITDRYRADAREVRADLKAFLGDLVKRGLLCRGPHGPRRRTALASLVLWPALLFVRFCLPSGAVRAAGLLTLAHLSFRLFGWVRTVAVWKAHHRPTAPPASKKAWEDAVQAVDQSVRRAAANHPMTMECKERALCCWALVHWAGLPATLVIGVHLFPLAGHCWCESGPWTLSDNRDRCEQFQPVIQYA